MKQNFTQWPQSQKTAEEQTCMRLNLACMLILLTLSDTELNVRWESWKTEWPCSHDWFCSRSYLILLDWKPLFRSYLNTLLSKTMSPKAERINGLAAMLGIMAAIGAYATTGQIIPGIWWTIGSTSSLSSHFSSWLLMIMMRTTIKVEAWCNQLIILHNKHMLALVGILFASFVGAAVFTQSGDEWVRNSSNNLN